MPSDGDIGARVILQGLTSPAGQHMNGCAGTLISYDSHCGRFGVKVDGVGSKSIRKENLLVARTRYAPKDVTQDVIRESLHDAPLHGTVGHDGTIPAVNAQLSDPLLRSRDEGQGRRGRAESSGLRCAPR